MIPPPPDRDRPDRDRPERDGVGQGAGHGSLPVPRSRNGNPPGDPAGDASGDAAGTGGIDKEAQPSAKTGVHTDMATGVIDTAQLGTLTQGVRPEMIAAPFVSDWSLLTDAEIMLRVRQGDDAGFNYLITKYQRQIVHFMFRMVHNQAVAEEMAQEVFLRVYRSRETYRAEARFSTWLYRIATNLGVNHARDTKHERAAKSVYLDAPDPETGSTPDVADGTPSAESDLLRGERLKAIRDIVLKLPDRQRTAVLMHKYQGMDYKQVGEVLKLSESATKSLLFRAYQTLRESLKEFA